MNDADYKAKRRRIRKAAALARKRSKLNLARKIKHGRHARTTS